MNPFKKLKAYLMYAKAVQMADECYKKNPHRWYVLRTDDGKLTIMDRYEFRRLKVKGYISKASSVGNLCNDAVYFTPTINGLQGLSPEDRKSKKEEFYVWYDMTTRLARKARAAKKRLTA